MRRFVKSNSVLYRLWFKLNKPNPKMRLPRVGDDLYIDGFPRSGNTFLVNLVRFLYPDLQFTSHLHAIAPIKLALRLGLPVFIIVRNPMDSVSSLYLSQFKSKDLAVNKGIASGLVKDYYDFYNYLNNSHDRLNIILFEEFKDDEKTVIDRVAHLLDRSPIQDFEASLHSYRKEMKDKEVQKSVRYGNKSGSLPSAIREEKKNKIKKVLLQTDLIKECNTEYRRLVSKVQKVSKEV